MNGDVKKWNRFPHCWTLEKWIHRLTNGLSTESSCPLHWRHYGHDTSLTIVYSTVYSDADQRKYQSSASLAFVRGIHRRPVNSPHTWPVTRKMLPFDDAIMRWFELPMTAQFPTNKIQYIGRIMIGHVALKDNGWGHIIVPLHSIQLTSLQWRPNEPDGVSNHQPHDCLL